MEYTHIDTHWRPHIDEIVGFKLLTITEEGEKLFPGISKVQGLTFVQSADYDVTEALAKGRVPLGIGHGKFDDHPLPGKRRKKGVCSAVLVAQELGLADSPAWANLLNYTLLNDTQGARSPFAPFELAYIPKMMYEIDKSWDHSQDSVVSWTGLAIEAILAHESKVAQGSQAFDQQLCVVAFDRALAAWLMVKFDGKKFATEEERAEFVFGSQELIAEQVIKRLAMAEDPWFKKILEFFRAKPETGNALFNIRSLLTLIYERDHADGDLAIEWLFMALETKYKEQELFHEAWVEFERRVETVTVWRGKEKLTIAIMTDCDKMLMGKVARAKGMAMLIQQQPWGNVQIFSNRKLHIKAYDLAAMIRLTEQELRGEVVTTDWRQLREEGLVPGCENWYYLLGDRKDAHMLLNGSLSVEQPPTEIPLDDLIQMAMIALDDQFFSSHSRQCLKGRCQKTVCPWYQYGLARCRKCRKQRHRRKTNKT